MTSSEKNTLFYIGLFGVLAYVGWKLWPALRRAINSGSSGGTSVSGTGASSASPYYPDYENESAQQGNLLSQLLNALSGSGSSGGHGSVSGGGAMPNSIGAGSYDSSETSAAAGTALADAEAQALVGSPIDDGITGLVDPGALSESVYEGLGSNAMPSLDYGPSPNVVLAQQGSDYGDYDASDALNQLDSYNSGQIDDSGDDSGS
jgi:hypothetical protein